MLNSRNLCKVTKFRILKTRNTAHSRAVRLSLKVKEDKKRQSVLNVMENSAGIVIFLGIKECHAKRH